MSRLPSRYYRLKNTRASFAENLELQLNRLRVQTEAPAIFTDRTRQACWVEFGNDNVKVMLHNPF